jgi:hypothetical protein
MFGIGQYIIWKFKPPISRRQGSSTTSMAGSDPLAPLRPISRRQLLFLVLQHAFNINMDPVFLIYDNEALKLLNNYRESIGEL